MAQSLTLRVGEHNQLRAPGDVERWTTSNPRVVAVTDEDVVNGRRGGALTALAPGRACITALGFGGDRLVEVEVTVAGSAALTVAVGATTRMERPSGVSRWTTSNPRIAEVGADGQIRGLAPGIVLVRGEGRGTQPEIQVRVQGTLEMEVQQTLSLADHFAVPVRGWRAESSAAQVDGNGILTAGDRPLTVRIIVTLADGEEFSFDVRIRRRSAAAAGDASTVAGPLAPPIPSSAALVPPAPTALAGPSSGPAGGVAAPVGDQQRRQVDGHIAVAETAIRQGNWQQAGALIMAADLAATGDEGLKERVRQTRERLRLEVLQRSGQACENVVADLRRGDCAHARVGLRDLQLPAEHRAVPDQLRALTQVMEGLPVTEGLSEEELKRVARPMEATWNAALGTGMHGVLTELAALAAQVNLEEMAGPLVRAFANPVLTAAPTPVRDALKDALRHLGQAGCLAVCDQLGITEGSDSAGRWSLDALVGLNPSQYAPDLITHYARLQESAQRRLVYWLGELVGTNSDILLELIAALLRKMPPDLRLARALQAKIGPAQLEKEAVKWAGGGHRGAQTVLERMYAYPASAFRRR